MIINAIDMYNYQITCNNSFLVGIIHSYSEEIISNDLIKKNLKLDRRKSAQVFITSASVVEE